MKPSRTLTRLSWVWPCLLLLAAGTVGPAGGETLERPLSCPTPTISIDESGRWARIDIPGTELDVPFGAPAVPSLRLKLALPEGLSVQAVNWEIDEQQTLALPRPLRPYAGEQASTQAEPPTIAPDPAIYGSSVLYPAEPARLIDEVELSNGARFAVVQVFPVQVRPGLDEITWVKRGRLILTLGTAPETGGRLPRLREVLTAAAIQTSGPAAQGRLLLAEPGLARTETPSVEGSPIVFAILSPPDDAMVAAWQALADWKTACGYPAAVFTTEWIDENYPAGADQPERIRAFLRDAYLHWGLTWALIGADPTLIPTRIARSWAHVPSANGTDIATDYYYACLEGNWDADGDGVFGESKALGNVGDNTDLTPEIEVGRVSARSATEVNDFLEKYFVYTRTPAADGYLDRILLLGEVLFHAEWTRTSNNGGFDCEEGDCQAEGCRHSSDGELICVRQDGAQDAVATGDQLRDSLGLAVERRYMLERHERWAAVRTDLNPAPEMESSTAVLARMSEGFGLVHHVGHGDRDRWATGDGRIEIGHLSNLTNGNDNHYFWTYGINCSSAAIDFDSFGERLVMMPGQGAIAYLGCTNADFPASARVFAEDFYNFLFGTPGATLGDGHFGSMGAHALTGDQINNESIYRFLIYTQILLGDPGMAVWRGTPTALATELVDHTNHLVPLGTTPLRVSVTAGAVPVAGARVCVHKEGEVYAIGLTAANGQVDLPFWPQTQGGFVVTATAPDHTEASLNGTVVAATSGSALVVDALGIVDDGTGNSAGNANQAIEVGETIRVSLTLENVGVATATNVQATLAVGGDAPAGCVTVTDGDAAIASIPAGSSGSDDGAFLLQFAAQPPDEAFGEADRIRLPLRLTLSSDDESAALDVYLDLTRPRLAISVNKMIETGVPKTKKLWLGVQNNGQGSTSRHLYAKLIPNPYPSTYIYVQTPSVTDTVSIAPGDTALIGPFQIRVEDAIHARLDFYLMDTSPTPDDTLHRRRLDVQPPGVPDSLILTGQRAAMGLKWKAPIDLGDGTLLGYKIYRTSGTGTPPFPEVVSDIIEGHRFFTDSGLAELAKYSYYVAAVDGGGNLGASSLVQSAYTSPGASPGWPHMMEQFTKASPLVCELDGATSRGREILFGGEYVYAFHGDGTEMNDGDRLERTSGPFGVHGTHDYKLPFWGKPAAADIDGDGAVEVVAISFPGGVTTNRGQLLCWSTWGGTPKWSVTFPAFWRSWNSPVLADLNVDGKLEIIFCGGTSQHAGVYVFQSDGTPWISSDANGRLKDLKGLDLYQTPAVGDVDGDGLPDIVVATRTDPVANGALWVVKANGETLPGFNELKFGTLGTPPLGQITTGSATLCNVDGVAGEEIFIVTTKRLWCFKKNGALVWGPLDLSAEFSLATYELLPEPALGYIVGDGQMNVAMVDAGGKLRVMRAATGVTVAPFPVQLDATARYGSCILANVDADVRPDIIFGDSKGRVHAYRFDGQLCAGFPISSGGDMVRQSLAAWDVDKDGYQNLVIQSNNQQQLSVLDIAGVTFPTDETEIVRRNPWPMRRRDARNTGCYTTSSPVLVQLVLESPEVSESGQVMLAWTSGEPAAAFRIRRSAGAGASADLVGEVPGGPGSSPQHYSFRDTPPVAGTYVYSVNPVQLDGVEVPGPTVEVTVGWTLPLRAGLQRVAPDPLPPGGIASITFGVPGGTSSSQVPTRLEVFDVQGRRMRALVDAPRPAGVHVITWDGRDDGGHRLATGLYLLRMEVRGIRSERRLLVIR